MELYETLYEKQGDTLVVRMPKEVDHHSGQGIREVTESYAAAGLIRQIVFDFSQTDFMDSTGIGILLGRYKYMKSIGGGIALTNVNSRIQRILKIAGIHQIMPMLLQERSAGTRR